MSQLLKTRTFLIILLSGFFFLVLTVSDLRLRPEDRLVRLELPSIEKKSPPRIFVSMGLCWDYHTTLYKKENFPYEEAARLVPKLWRKIGNVSVILQIVHNNTNDIKTDEFKTFVHEMEEDGVIIKTVAAGDMDCVLKSQLIRLFAGDLIENDDDIMLTSDVDAFPMNSSLLEPLQNKNYKIWIYQYDMAIVKEFTFSMSFIAMTKKTWRKLLRVETPEEIVAIYMKPLLLQAVSPWGYDQLILSRIILESRLCTLPTNNSLWEQVRIPPKTFDDSQTCFHGNQYGNCDRALRMRDYGCKWWHFHAFERETELNDKFKEIIGDKPAPRKAQLAFLDIKMEVQRLLGLRT